MTLPLRTFRLPRPGGRVTSYPVMSLLSAGVGRRGYFGPCGSVGWKWNSFAGTAGAARSGNLRAVAHGCLFSTKSPSAVVSSDVPDCSSRRGFHGYPGPVPRWRLNREGRFLRERMPSARDCFGDGCSLCAER